jgi:hypothetical protein
MSSFNLRGTGEKFGGESFVPTIMAEDLHFGLKMEVAYFLEISVSVYQITRCHVSGDCNLHSHHHRENFISGIILLVAVFECQSEGRT